MDISSPLSLSSSSLTTPARILDNSSTNAGAESDLVDDGCHGYKNEWEKQAQNPTNDIAEFIPFDYNKQGITFEEIAHLVTGMVQPMYSAWDTLDAMLISNKQLALSIAKDVCDPTEEYKLETILSSVQKRQQFFNDPEVQIILLQAYLDGVDMDSRVLEGLQDCTPKLPPDDQNQFAYQLLSLISAGSVSSRKITILFHFLVDPVVQQNIAYAIFLGEFGTDPAVFKAVAENLTIFTDPKAQQFIAFAISSGTFDNDSAVLKAVAENLTIFTDPKAQRDIANAIFSGTFGTDPTVRKAVAENLTVFTDPNAQQMIARAIYYGKFGTDPAVFKAVAENLTIFTDPDAQQMIARAIFSETFCIDPAVFKAVAENLTIFTDPKAQQFIACAIWIGKFGIDPVVLKAVVENLTIFTDPKAQRDIANAIFSGKFGTDPTVRKAILLSVPELLDTQTIINMIRSIDLELPEKIAILRGRKFSLEPDLPTKLNIPEQDLPGLFGVKAYSGIEVASLLRTRFSSLNPDGIASICDAQDDYALQINDQQLILCPLTRDRADFMGWMSLEYGAFYKKCITHIQIFDFSVLDEGGYPTTFVHGSDLSPTHGLFATLPRYLQVTIRDNQFSQDEF